MKNLQLFMYKYTSNKLINISNMIKSRDTYKN